MNVFVQTIFITAGAVFGLAVLLTLLQRLGRWGRAASEALARPPLLDVVLAALTCAPWIVAAALRGWAGVGAAIVGQMAALYAWIFLHELLHLRAVRGPRIVRFTNRLVGRPANHLALWLTVLGVPVLWLVRVLEIFIYPTLVWLLRFPRYDHAEWVTLSRHQFRDLVGHDLVWCLYCDWMTGTWSLGTEMLRNVESFWCPIRFAHPTKLEHCANIFPDIDGGWVPADGSMAQVQALLEQKYGGEGDRSWFGHRAREDWIYLDNNATTRPDERVVEAMQEASRQLWANPSSVHRFGQMVRQRIEQARRSVAELLNVQPRDLIFTSGGTESNNLALFGVVPDVLITTRIEHRAITDPAETLRQRGVSVVHLDIDQDGVIDLDHLDALLAEHARDGATVLVSVQWANNETGVLQPIAAIAQHLATARQDRRAKRLLLHSDATQAVGKVPVDLSQTPIDMLTLSAHKFHGPKGVGGLYIRPGVRLRAVQRGGPHERELRAGTQNTTGIVGLGMAAQLARDLLADTDRIAQLRNRRDRFERAVIEQLTAVTVNSGGAERLWNTSNLAFPGLAAEAILVALSECGVCASAGAACSSGSLEPSPVLLAMGVGELAAHGSVRFALSPQTTDQEIDRAVEQIVRTVRELSQTIPVG